MQESKSTQIEVFLNSVPILASLSREEKMKLAGAFEEQTFRPQQPIVEEASSSILHIKARALAPIGAKSDSLASGTKTLKSCQCGISHIPIFSTFSHPGEAVPDLLMNKHIWQCTVKQMGPYVRKEIHRRIAAG